MVPPTSIASRRPCWPTPRAARTNPRAARLLTLATTTRSRTRNQFCRYRTPGQPPLFLWGDSHADALQASVQQLAHAQQMPLTVATFSACPPLLRGAVASGIRGMPYRQSGGAGPDPGHYGATVLLVALERHLQGLLEA